MTGIVISKSSDPHNVNVKYLVVVKIVKYIARPLNIHVLDIVHQSEVRRNNYCLMVRIET
jgi:hypothetical protein